MLKQQARLVATVVFLADLLLIAAAFLSAHLLRDEVAPAFGVGLPGLPPLARHLPLLPLALAVWGSLLWTSGRYRSHRRMPLSTEAWAVVRVSLLAAGLFALVILGLRLDERLFAPDRISRSWLALFAALAGLFLLAEKVALRLLARRIRARGLNFRNIVVVGTGTTAASIGDSIREHRFWGYRLLGFLTAPDADREPNPGATPLLGTLADLELLRARQAVDEVVFAVPPADLRRFEDLVLALQEQGILVRFALDLLPHAQAHVQLEEIDGVPLLSMSTSPSGALQLASKRAMDLLLAAVLLVLALPLCLGAALAIRMGERGTILFRQRRCGQNGRLFTLFKFRTMVEGAEAKRADVAHLNELDGPVFKVRNDPRVTAAGRLLRKFSLDELPQLWNVLRGDMSLVGPRPPVPEEVEKYERWQKRRLAMKPGMTGLWQVSGRNAIDFERWIELDLHYIDHWSPWLDLKILAKTVPVVLSGRGAS